MGALGAVVRRAVALEPSRRYASAQALGLDLRRLADGAEEAALPPDEALWVRAVAVLQAVAGAQVLWALEDYRAWAQRLSRPGLMPLARNAFELLSSNRRRLSGWLHLEDEAVRRHLETEAGPPGVPKCAPGEASCRIPPTVTCPGCGGPRVEGRAACPHCLASVVGAWEQLG